MTERQARSKVHRLGGRYIVAVPSSRSDWNSGGYELSAWFGSANVIGFGHDWESTLKNWTSRYVELAKIMRKSIEKAYSEGIL